MVPDSLSGGSMWPEGATLQIFCQEGLYPPSPGWILVGQNVLDALAGGSWWPGRATF